VPVAILRKQMGDRDEGLAPLADVRKLAKGFALDIP
jgi:hypothetical protein